jgi:hypothetical protein
MDVQDLVLTQEAEEAEELVLLEFLVLDLLEQVQADALGAVGHQLTTEVLEERQEHLE